MQQGSVLGCRGVEQLIGESPRLVPEPPGEEWHLDQ